ncbi:MAG: competence protein ComK [Bacilli bacterium]|nr:competence protein ComK [Bacilli bacterium]
MDIDSYEINKNTCAVLNVNDEVSKVIENNQEYFLPKTSFEVMEDSCSFYGSSYDGRLKGTKMILGSNYKLPIIVEETNSIIFFPTNGLANNKCSWISLNNVSKYEPQGGYTKVTFEGGKSVVLRMSCSSFEMQLLRATRLQQLFSKRIEKKTM